MDEQDSEPADSQDADAKNMSAEEIAELQKQNCIFCKIASKEIPARILHEDDDVICVLDINPVSEGHLLVFPKKHFMILPHIPEELLGKMFSITQLMSNTLLKTLQCRGTSVFVANGMAAGQKAPHVLIHVLPRREHDNLLELPHYEINDEQSNKLKQSLKPYVQQIFGAKPNVYRDSVKNMEKKQERIQEQHDKEKPKKHTEIHDNKNIHNKPKIDLDDVTKLFG